MIRLMALAVIAMAPVTGFAHELAVDEDETVAFVAPAADLFDTQATRSAAITLDRSGSPPTAAGSSAR
jgi:hypothetical protein